MAETIFCIVNEQRQRIYSDLKGIDGIRTLLNRQGLEWEPYGAELGTYVQRITQLLDGLPRDPRCEQSGSN